MSSLSARTLSETIGAIYGAGLDPSGSGWVAVLGQLSTLVAGDGPVALMLERRRFDYAQAHYVRTDPADVARYQQYYARIDPIFEPLVADARPGDLLLSDVLACGRDFERTEFYSDWLRPLGLRSGSACVLMRHGSATALTYAVRPRGRGSFSASDREVMALLLSHCAVAVRTSLRLAALTGTRDAAWSALDHCADAVLLVDGEAGIHSANRAAEALLRDADGLTVEPGRCGRPGRLRAATPAVTAALRRLIALTARVAAPSVAAGTARPCAPPHDGSLALARPSGREAYAVLASPLLPGRDSGETWVDCLGSNASRATVAMFITDPAAAQADAGMACRARLRALYGLTPAEAAVAVAVGRGDGLRAVAAAHGVGLATVRSQARQVYRKTEVRGQAALARLVERMARTH